VLFRSTYTGLDFKHKHLEHLTDVERQTDPCQVGSGSPWQRVSSGSM
jgi:hypothetical protein